MLLKRWSTTVYKKVIDNCYSKMTHKWYENFSQNCCSKLACKHCSKSTCNYDSKSDHQTLLKKCSSKLLKTDPQTLLNIYPQLWLKKWFANFTQNQHKIVAKKFAQKNWVRKCYSKSDPETLRKIGRQTLLKKVLTQKNPTNVTKEVILKRCSESDQLKLPKID